jgi:HEAT repeat protein
VVALPAAWFLDYATKRHHFEGMGFGILFGIAVASGLVSLGLILRQPEPRRPPAPNAGRSEGLQGLLTYYRLPFTDKNFVRLMLFNCMLGLGQNFAAPFFTVYALQVLKLDYTWLQIFSTIASVSSLASMPLFGYLSDKVGSKPLLAISVIGVFTTPISWMLTVPNHFALTAAILSEMNIVSGMFWACAGLMQFNLLIASAPPERTTVYAATMAATTGLVGGIAPLLGGVMMHMLSGWHATFLHIHMTAFHVTFFVASLLRLAALAFFGSISEPHSSSARDVIQQLTRANPRAWMHLRKLQEGSLEDRLRATEALGESRTVLATGELTVALTDPSHDVRAEAARALGEIGDPRTVRALMSALEDPAPEVTEEAIRALARIGDREANAPLIALLCDTARAVPRRIRIAAADALGSLGGSDAADALMDLLRRIDDEETGEVVVRALGGIGDHRAVPHLVEILTRQSTPRGMRLAIVRTLGEIADEAAVPALRTVLAADDVDAGLLPPLADAFARLKDVPSLPRLIDCLTYLPSTVARRQVAHAIGVIAGHGEGIYALLAKEEMARDTALTRMVGDMRKQLKGPGARRSLQAALQAYTEGSYALCLRALGRVYQPIMQARAESPRPIDEPTRTVLTSLFQTRPAAPPLEAVLLAFAVMNDVLDEGEMGV